jgi:hypothetical protein
MDKHLIFYLMFFPTAILFLWGMGFRMSIWLEGSIEGAEDASKWEKFKILLGRGWRGFHLPSEAFRTVPISLVCPYPIGIWLCGLFYRGHAQGVYHLLFG